MSEFVELLVGTFANKRQAQSHPTRYAHIRVSHRLLGENRIYGEQAYNYLLTRPSRQFVIDVVEDGEESRLRNYEIEKLSTSLSIFSRAETRSSPTPYYSYRA